MKKRITKKHIESLKKILKSYENKEHPAIATGIFLEIAKERFLFDGYYVNEIELTLKRKNMGNRIADILNENGWNAYDYDVSGNTVLLIKRVQA